MLHNKMFGLVDGLEISLLLVQGISAIIGRCFQLSNAIPNLNVGEIWDSCAMTVTFEAIKETVHMNRRSKGHKSQVTIGQCWHNIVCWQTEPNILVNN